MSSVSSSVRQVITAGGLSIVYDSWLSEVMSREVHRVSGKVEEEDEAQRAVQQIAHLPGFSFARVRTDDVRTTQMLERCGFHLVDTAVTLEVSGLSASSAGSGNVRLARPEDRKAVEGIARRSFTCSRFHLDPAIPKSLADEIKAQWAGNFFLGKRGDQMVVAEKAGEIVGFAQLLKPSGNVLVIDLIAVEKTHRGQGLSKEMIRFSYMSCGHPRIMRAGTQIANTVSLGVYQDIGFRIVSSDYVFHHHLVIG
ncbi:MAG TPA: GNAT family N-acetyltransferase [Nitrospiraceae bacterium]|nr:GNAT family N-acetyltransferase [Nitrospiraceae bacterium]